MKTILCLLLAALALPASPARAATNDLTSALQRGLFEEEVSQNLVAAIQAYQTVASQFDKDRKLAATAIFRLGECYRKQGNTNDAATQFERILREFSDQPILVTLSRQNLVRFGSAPVASAAPVISDAARQEQKRLLEEEIKLVQKQLDLQQKQYAGSNLSQEALWQTERELLKLKRQVAALDAGLPLSITAAEAPATATSTDADEVKRIQALIKDSPDLINAPDRKGETLLQAAAAKGKLAVVKVLLDSGAAVNSLQQPGLTPLHYAAANGHKAIVDLLLSKGAKADAQTEAGVTPLHLAARKGYESVAKALLAAGASVNAAAKRLSELDTEDLQYRIGSGQTPLHLAVNAGYPGIVQLLLAKGADANAEDGDSQTGGRTPLSYAAQKRYEAIMQLLLAAHANPNAGRVNLPLATAAYQGDLPALNLLLANGADPNTNAPVNWTISRRGSPNQEIGKFTPLFLAVNQRHADAAKELLRCKADPNITPAGDNPVLYEAMPDVPTLRALLEGGADPNVQTLGKSPMLLSAVMDNNQPAVELLLAHQADVNCTNKDGTTPLYAAAGQGNKAIAELLLKAGAAVNAKDNGGNTPLHWAVNTTNPELVELLLANKADPNAKNSAGWTPLHRAVTGDRREMVQLLLANKADPNAKNFDGYTPLHFAVADGRREMVELLLANKADPNERNNYGQTPLDLAKSKAQYPQGQPPGAGTPFAGPMAVPPGALPSARPLRLPGAPGTPAPAPAPESKPETIADLLRRNGASDDLPRMDCIVARRPSANYSSTVFTKGTNDWNQFTVLDLIGVQCGFLAGSPSGGERTAGFSRGAFFHDFHPLPFPDLARLRIRRPAANLKSWEEQAVDLRPVLESGDCSKDVRVEWGNVVEIPEADHPLYEPWPGFSPTQLANLKKCLTRQVEIVINGQATNIILAPQVFNVGEGRPPANLLIIGGAPADNMSSSAFNERQPYIHAHMPFWLKPVLLQSKLLLTSSDLRHVKVTRRDSASGQAREWVVDCSEASPAPDLWLRDGDKIEVPEKKD